MTIPVLTTGDDFTLPLILKKNALAFAISGGAVVKARLVSVDRLTLLCDPVTQASSTPGADWANSLVVVSLPASATASMQHQGLALLEIQVDDGGKITWFVTVKIVRGSID